MRLARIWDYFMRRKLLLVVLLAMFVSGFCGYNFVAQQRRRDEMVVAPSTAKDNVENGLALHIIGENQEAVYRLTLSANFDKATVEVVSGLLTSEAYVRIFDATGGLIAGSYTTIYDAAAGGNVAEDLGVKYYFPGTPESYEIALTPGAKIELSAETVKFYSTLDGAEVTELTPDTGIESYIIVNGGLQRSDWDEAAAQNLMYRQLLRYATQEISRYEAEIPEHVLHNKTLDTERKTEIMRLYARLLPEDRLAHADFIMQLEKGGAPILTYRGANEYKLGEIVDLLSLIDIYDNEDGEITRDKLESEGAVDFTKSGEYEIKYHVADSDGNQSELILTIVVAEERKDTPSQDPTEDQPVTEPVEDNGGGGKEDGADEGKDKNDETEGESEGTRKEETEDDEEIIETTWNTEEPKIDYVVALAEVQVEGPNVTETAETSGVQGSVDVINADGTNAGREDIAQLVAQQSSEEKVATAAKRSTPSGVFLIVLGVIVICGLLKFILDHYVR